jgi:hypothetical protein
MRLPRFATIFWFAAFVVVSIILLIQQPWTKTKAAWDDLVGTGETNILFSHKVFADGVDGYLTMSGTLTGNGVGYKNNSVAISCIRDEGACFVASIEQVGSVASSQCGRRTGRPTWPSLHLCWAAILAFQPTGGGR